MALRTLKEIAWDINKEWSRQPGGIYYAAKPYLSAMSQIHKITDMFGADDARSIVLYFLSNAATFKGDAARRLKAELKDHLKEPRT